ncbi:unnamed protein product, partial [marine sediment metagenome]
NPFKPTPDSIVTSREIPSYMGYIGAAPTENSDVIPCY